MCQPGECEPQEDVIDESFDSDAGGFVYQDDPFGTNIPDKADGTWEKLWDRANGNAFPSAELKYGEGYLLRAQEAGGSGMPDLFTKNALLDIETSDSRLDFSDRVVVNIDPGTSTEIIVMNYFHDNFKVNKPLYINQI